MRVTVPCPLPSKKNSYEIRFNPIFWKEIREIAAGLAKYVKGPLYWIGPPRVIKDVQSAIGYIAHQALDQDTDGPVRVDLWVSDKLDADNAAGVVLDGIQCSGRIRNDMQVKELRVHKLPGGNTKFDFDIRLLDPDNPESWERDKS